MSDRLRTIRWRLLTGFIAFVAAVAVTLPAAASKVDLGKRVADIWPNAEVQVADVIWPNALPDDILSDVIWPNAGVIGGVIDGTSSDQTNQDSQGDQGNQDSQN